MPLDQRYHRRFPALITFREVAKKNIPHFSWEYLDGGIDREICKNGAYQDLDSIRLVPRYLRQTEFEPDTSVSLFGTKWKAPFGVAPIGLSGLMWPGAAKILAKAAQDKSVPFTLSTFATDRLEDIASQHKNPWFQLYMPNDKSIRQDMLDRAWELGYRHLVWTVDIPAHNRRQRGIAVGLSLPPSWNWKNIAWMLTRPKWLAATLKEGTPRFKIIQPYMKAGESFHGSTGLLARFTNTTITMENLSWLRSRWKGKLMIKGVLDPQDAKMVFDAGCDGVIVSNHGGRQLDAAPSAVQALIAIRKHCPDGILIADGGVRSGLDVVRYLSCGANMVLVGRSLMLAVCAGQERGALHGMELLDQDIRLAMIQLGARCVSEIPSFRCESF